jgi:hypothetical protein
MVIAQPFLELSNHEPFRCITTSKPRLLSEISKTLEIARGNYHGQGRTHFTIFPEYSVCGIDGISLINTALVAENWPSMTVVIAGTDAITKAEFISLCAQENTHFDETNNSLEGIQPKQWINCQITWIKGANGVVEKWLQPKIEPAWPEQNITCAQMYQGKSIFAFQGPYLDGTLYRFSTLVCFDWIGAVAGTKVWRWLLNDLQRQAVEARAEYSLSWLFVIQSNTRPSHHTFLTEAAQFFQQNAAPAIHRDGTCLVFANGAGKSSPGIADTFGQTSLIFSPQALFTKPKCSPTFSNGGLKFRASEVLNDFHDVLFRERGACVHSFAQINPKSVAIGPAGRTQAILHPFVFSLNNQSDERTPSNIVPASVKWVNDELDHLPKLSTLHPGVPLAHHSDEAHTQTAAALRQEPGQRIEQAIDIAHQRTGCEVHTQHRTIVADSWNGQQEQALEHLVHSLNIVSIGAPAPRFEGEKSQAEITLNGEDIDFVAVRGQLHEDCLRYREHVFGVPIRPTLLVTRDHDNTDFLRREGSILETETSQIGQERNITNPNSVLYHIGYSNLLKAFRRTRTADQLPGAINAALID